MIGLECLLQFFDTLFELRFVIVLWMDVLAQTLELFLLVLDLACHALDLAKLYLLLVLVLIELGEELAELVFDRISSKLAFLHKRACLVLLRNQVFELVLQLTNLHVDACDL